MMATSKRTPSPTNGKKPPIVGFVTKLKDMVDGDGESLDIISVRKQIVITNCSLVAQDVLYGV